MSKMKKLLLIFLIIHPSLSYGITVKAVLEKIAENWDPILTYEARFTQVTESLGSSEPIHYRGEVYLQRPLSVRVNFFIIEDGTQSEHISSATPDQWYYTDGEYLWFYDRSAKSVHKDLLNTDNLPYFITIMAAAQNFDYESFRQNHYIKLIEEEVVNDLPAYLLRVRGREDEKGEWDLWVDKETYLPLKNTSRFPDVTYTVQIENQEINTDLPENIFDPKVTTDTQLIDHTLEY